MLLTCFRFIMISNACCPEIYVEVLSLKGAGKNYAACQLPGSSSVL